MKKSTIPQNLKTLKKWYDASTLDLNHPIQRASAQWNNLQQSLLVHSILSDYIVPPLYLTKEKQGKTTIYHLLEGKQRITSLFSFINDEFSLHPKTPVAVFDGNEYVISLKKFSELETELREEILGFFFTIYQIEDATEEEIEESFARLNSGTPLSKIQQARPKLGTELADWANKLVAKDFFQKSLNLTLAQLRREDDFLMLMTGMMLLDTRCNNGFKIKTSASAAECVRFAESIKNNYSQEKREDIELLVEYLSDTFGGAEYKFLKKNNVPIVMYVAQVAIEHGISEKEYLNTVVEFYESDCTEAYNEASGSGNVKMVNVSVRINELLGYLMRELPDYFKDDDKIPADFVKEVEGDDAPIQESDTPSTAGSEIDPDEKEAEEDENSADSEESENSEENSEGLSLDEESEEGTENTEDSTSEDTLEGNLDDEESGEILNNGVDDDKDSSSGESVEE